MVSHPHPARGHRDVRKVILSNSAGFLDEWIVRAPKSFSDEQIAHRTMQIVVGIIQEVNSLYPGDTISIEEIAA
jgi:hypothetical protein